MLNALLGWKGYAAAALAAAIVTGSATFYVTSLGYRLTIAGMEIAEAKRDAQNASDALTQFQTTAANITEAANEYAGTGRTLNSRMAAISKDIKMAMAASPLPDGCTPGAARLRAISEAVAATNAAARHGAGAALPSAQ